MSKYIIFSLKETKYWGEPMFWSNKHGWIASIPEATKFTSKEIKELNLPLPDGEWIAYSYR